MRVCGCGGGLALCQQQPERLFSSGGGVGAGSGSGGEGGRTFFCPRTTVTIHVGNSAPAMSIGIWLIHSQWVHVTRKYCLSGTRILHQAAEIKM